MGTELNIEQGLLNVATAFEAWGQEAYVAGLAGPYGNWTQTINAPAGTNRMELHFLTNTPVMRQWTGARRYKALRHYSQSIKYIDWEATIALSKNLVDTDPAGVVSSLMPQFTSQLDAFDSAVATAFDQSSGAGPTGFDGVALFSASHPHSSSGSTQSNLAAATNLSHANLVAAEYAGALLTQENTRPLNVVYNTMRVGPKLKRRAMELLSAQRTVAIDATAAEATASVVAITTRNNTYQGDMTLVVDPRVTTFYWDLIDTTKGPVRPMTLFVVQNPEVVNRTDATDPHVFEHKEYIFGVTGKFSANAGHWYTCYRGTGTA